MRHRNSVGDHIDKITKQNCFGILNSKSEFWISKICIPWVENGSDLYWLKLSWTLYSHGWHRVNLWGLSYVTKWKNKEKQACRYPQISGGQLSSPSPCPWVGVCETMLAFTASHVHTVPLQPPSAPWPLFNISQNYSMRRVWLRAVGWISILIL